MLVYMSVMYKNACNSAVTKSVTYTCMLKLSMYMAIDAPIVVLEKIMLIPVLVSSSGFVENFLKSLI